MSGTSSPTGLPRRRFTNEQILVMLGRYRSLPLRDKWVLWGRARTTPDLALLSALARGPAAVRSRVAYNPHCPGEMFSDLMHDSAVIVRPRTAKSPYLTNAQFGSLARDGSARV